jgi:hypothetical protein
MRIGVTEDNLERLKRDLTNMVWDRLRDDLGRRGVYPDLLDRNSEDPLIQTTYQEMAAPFADAVSHLLDFLVEAELIRIVERNQS